MEDLQENINIEDENLNNIESDIDIQEDEKTTFTKEEVEEIKRNMQSNSDKWVQKLIAEKKLLETYTEELSNVGENPEHLIDLMSDNPKVAQMILDKYYWWEDIEDYKQRIWYEENYQDPELIKKKIKEEAKKLAEDEKLENAKNKFIEDSQMSDDEKEKFIETFEDLKWSKTFKSLWLKEQFTKAYKLINDNDKELSKMKTQENIWKSMSIWEGKSWNGETDWNKSKNPFDDFFKKFN